MKPPFNRSESVEVGHSDVPEASPIGEDAVPKDINKDSSKLSPETMDEYTYDGLELDVGYVSASPSSIWIDDTASESGESAQDDIRGSRRSKQVTFHIGSDANAENQLKKHITDDLSIHTNLKQGEINKIFSQDSDGLGMVKGDRDEKSFQAPIFTTKSTLYESQQENTEKYPPASNGSNKVPLTHKPIKPGRQILRWNLLFNLLVWVMVSLPIWVPFVSKTVAIYLLPSVQSVFVLMWLVICLLASRNVIRLYRHRNHDFQKDIVESSDIHHLFIISCYKEPVSLIAQSVNTIANQKDVHNITMTVSFEEKTPDLDKKIKKLTKRFQDSGFARLLFTVHPFGLENEIPGKCSNANNGFRKSAEILQREMGLSFDPDRIIVTTCDADSQFSPNYTGALASRFIAAKDKHNTIYQAPLFYNWGLDGASFITRVTGLVRSTLMLGALIPFNINSMSIFSFSLRLCIDGNFVHPAYQMDDIICLIRWMGVTGRKIRICFLPVPVLSGPTTGSTVELDIMEWARQARRWTIGAAEVFHYFVVKSRKMPKLPALSWGLSFLIYYGILLCSGSLYSLSMSLSVYFIIGDSFVPYYVSYWLYALAATQQFCFLIVFILDVFTTRILNVKEHISFIRNVFQWIMSPVVLLCYSLVEFYALHEVAIRGKKVCKHGASKKDNLKT
ncbi:uncharacterized protein LOC126822626 [Patella vulgata]|uniref:uncharacterized protein LOC126822626 n=1 Tax=Patella vulgata TaxID=6465 RepID=UPI00217FED51|nr:uncharacterized protein LOC126822626 [Patella vulgata]